MGNYQGYQKYKYSGVEWLGDIPEHWEAKRLNFLTKRIGDGIHSTPQYVDSSEYYFINGNNLVNGNIFINESTKCVSKDEFEKYNLNLDRDTLLLSINGTIGNVAFYQNELVMLGKSAAYITLKSDIFKNFAYYCLLSKNTKNYFFYEVTGTTIFNLSLKSIKNTFFPTPPLDEQEKIAQFLDYKTKQIDELIKKKETLIEKLDEKRTALISHAVTKGLDSSVPIKDSGIEWLGDIPEHWEAVRLKHITNKIIDGAHFTPTYVDEGIPFLRVTDIVQAKNNSIDMNNIKFIPEEEHKILSIRCKPEKGDLLYSKNGTIGVSRIVNWDFEFSIFVSLCLIKVIKEKVNIEFLQYSLLGKLTETQISIGAKSNTVTNLHLDKIKEFLISLPTLDEQRKIIQYLDQKTAKIDHQKAKIQEAIELLKEYRTSLITNAVTGKIDVRQIAVP